MIAYIVFPLIGASIGWLTNYVAIKMLFRPRKQVNFLGIKIQGIFPKRKKFLAERLSKIVSKDLFSMEELKKKIVDPKNLDQLKEGIEGEVEKYLREKVSELNPFIASFINDKRIEQIKGMVCGEIDKAIPKLLHEVDKKVDSIDIEKMVYDKVAAFSDEKLEDMLMSVLSKELKFVEIAGAVLGFIVGIIQAIISPYIS